MSRKATPDVLAPPANGSRANTDDLVAMFGPVGDGERVVQIALADLDDNPYQRRSASISDDDPDLINLATDIASQGIIQPLVVRMHPDRDGHLGEYQIAAGHRRRLAAHLAGLETVPCVVRPLTDDQMLDVVFAENYHRADINAIDRAQLMAMLAEQGLTQQQIADRFSVSRPTVANALRLLQLPAAIQADVASGTISNRQAEALIPLATLPAEAQQALNSYSDLASAVEKARNGAPSDNIRSHVQGAVLQATKALPDHWRGYNFQDLAEAVQPTCAGCSYIRTVGDEDRCTMPPCWHAKSSAWQAIEHRQIVELTGVPIFSESGGTAYDGFYSDARRLLGLPETADSPPAHQCPNLRVRKGYSSGWSFMCHYGVGGLKECTCLAKARKATTTDGKRHLKQIIRDVEAALTPHLATFPLDALRLLARVYGKWEQREQVVTWDADHCIPVIVSGLIKVYQPYEPEKHLANVRTSMEQLLAIAGRRAPWLPPLEEEIARQLSDARVWLDDFLHPGDGLPAPDSMTTFLDGLRALADTIMHHVHSDQRDALMKRQTYLWFEALALQDRVQASYAAD
jgi:ParB/RepB/Spo0J family partition protein